MRTQMKLKSVRMKRFPILLAAALPVVAVFSPHSAFGGALYFDTNGSAAGFGGGSSTIVYNWKLPTSGVGFALWNDSSGSGTPATWLDSTGGVLNDAIFNQDTSVGGSTTTSIVADQAINANSLQFISGENYTFKASANTITLGAASGNGGIAVNSSGTYTFDSPLVAQARVAISATGGAGAVINFGDKTNSNVANSFSTGLDITSAMRVNFNSSKADGANQVVGGNSILIHAPDARLTTLSGLSNAEYDVYSTININPDNTNPFDASTHPYGFYVSLGATTFAQTSSSGFLVWKGQLTSPQPDASHPLNLDPSDTSSGSIHPTGVVLGNDTFLKGGGNAVTVFANSNNNYTGSTIIGSTGGAINNGVVVGNGAGSLRLGANNALPATTDLIFGLPNVAKVWGNFDLGGFSTHLNSIQTPYASTAGSVALGITNSGASLGTLLIQSATDTSATIHQFDSPIGAAAGNLGTFNTAGTTQLANNNIAVVYDSPATLQLGAANTYTGGTTIHQGTIALADSTLAFTPGSLSPSGSLAFTGSGTLDLAGQNQQVTGLTSTGAVGTITNAGAAATFTVNVTGSNSNTFGGAITNGAGSISFKKTGTGSLVLTGGSHAYSGPTSVIGGSLVIDGSLPAGTAVTVGPTAILGGHGTVNGAVTVQTGAILAPGESQTLTLGSLTVQQGADLRFSLAAAGSSDSVNVLGNLTFTGANRSAVEITGSTLSTATPYHLLTAGGVLSGGIANLILYPLPAGYSGVLQQNGQNIDLLVTQVTPDIWTGAASSNWNTTDTDWTRSGSAATYTTGDQVVFDDTASGSTSVSIPSSVSPSAITFNNTTKNYTLAGPVAGNTALVVNGGGQVTLSGANTFSGVVQINNGILNAASDTNLGDSGNLIVISTPSTQGTLVVANGFSSNREFTLHGTANFSVGTVATDTATISGVLDGGGSVVKQGPGTLVLSNASNSFNGVATISAGTLSASVTGALPATTDVSIAAGATLLLGASQTVGSVGGAGAIQLNGSGVLLASGGDNASTTVSGAITGAGTITKNGTGTLTLGNASNTFGGAGKVITVNGGTLAVSADANLGNSANSVSLNDGTTLALNTGSASLTSARAISLSSGSATISFNSVNPTTTAAPAIAINGALTGSGALNIVGPGIVAPVSGSSAVGVLTLGNSGNSFSGGLTINNAVVTASSAASLGSGGITLAGAVVNLPSSGSTSDTLTVGNFGATLNVPSAGTFTLNSLVAGGQNTGITKTGAGVLVLNAAPSVYQGAWNVNAGTLKVTASDVAGGSNQSALGTGGTTGGTIPSNSVIINGGTLQLANVPVGQYFSSAFSPQIYIAGGTLLGTGNASYAYDANASNAHPGNDDASGGLLIDRGTVAKPTAATLATSAASDVLAIQNSIMQYDTAGAGNITGVSNAAITVSGPGKVLLQSGTVSQGSSTNNHSSSTFAGSWNVSNGILQIGPVIPDANPVGTGGRPFAEPLNALGFVNGDPDQPNPVKVTGGVLAVGVDAPSANPNWTANTPANPTPNYLRNAVELAGGSLAATGFETAYSSNLSDPQGIPTSTPVTAQFGGAFQLDAGTSKVLVYDPSNTTQPMHVQLVGGTRSLPNGDIINGVNVSSVTYNTTWTGTLVIDPGTTTGGSFDILRSAGTYSVTTGAKIQVNQGATLNLGGAADSLTDGAHFVDIQNDSTTSFNVLAAAHQIGSLTGLGNTTISAGATLSAKTLRQNALTINGAALVRQQVGTRNNTATVSVVSSLALAGVADAWTGKLDLADNDLVVKGGNLTTIANQLKQGFNLANNGFWNGTGGIVSSSAAANGTHLTTLGVIANNDGSNHPIYGSGTTYGLFDGQNVTTTDVLVKYTYFGDADLSGKVDGTDYAKIDNGFNTHLTGWFNGDFNYDGVVDGSDYSLIDNAFNTQGATLGGGTASAASMFANTASEISGINSGSTSAVPEPGSLSLLAIGSAALMVRRRRQI